MMHKFKIKTTGLGRGKVFMDDQEVGGVARVNIKIADAELTEVTLTFLSTDVEYEDAEVIIEKPEGDG